MNDLRTPFIFAPSSTSHLDRYARTSFRWQLLTVIALASLLATPVTKADDSRYEVPMRVGTFEQQVHQPYTAVEGLPSADVLRVAYTNNAVFAETAAGIARFQNGQWDKSSGENTAFSALPSYPSLLTLVGSPEAIRDVAQHNGEIAVAATSGLYIGNGEAWQLAMPQQGADRWAPLDVRAVVFDADGKLWFACPQGVGYRVAEGDWRLFTGADGLPYNDFTCMAAGAKGVWFGTTNGAIRYADGLWEFRQGGRWLLDNHVRDIAVDATGNAWIATAKGVSCIEFRSTTLAAKAKFFAEEIDKYHRRTRLGYVNPAMMTTPGDKSTAVPAASDNDGHFTGLYLGAASFGYAATGDPKLRKDAVDAFHALSFLSKVTEGGTNPAPKGFIARAVEPTSGPDPNLTNNPEVDRVRQAERDKRWKIMDPRWPIDETGEWYWKCDSSSDELDGYYFGFGIYFDHVCKNDEERNEVRDVVRSMTDHIINHGFTLTDHDGKPTRWAHFSPDDLNRNEDWWVERGLNSNSILTYLNVAFHITGDQKYRDVYLKLAIDEGYAMNVMTQPKVQLGPGSFGQADDNMAFMNYYHLVLYETDPTLLSMYRNAMFYHWAFERFELNPFFNFVYAACCLGKERIDPWGTQDMSPLKPWLDVSVDTLRRYPLDLVDWPMSNAHRIDVLPLPAFTRGPGNGHVGKGYCVNGNVFRIDEQHAVYWGDDPWGLTGPGDGTRLREGVSYLLAYYMGLTHGFIAD